MLGGLTDTDLVCKRDDTQEMQIQSAQLINNTLSCVQNFVEARYIKHLRFQREALVGLSDQNRQPISAPALIRT